MLPATLVDLLREWRDFFTVIGGAAAALVGAMFVVVSIGIGFFNRGHGSAIGSFLTQTVFHLSAVIVFCAFTMVPTLDWTWFGAGLILGALVGGYVLGAIGFAGYGLIGSLVTAGAVKRLGYQAEVADGGEGALEACSRRHFDAILLDCEMPVMDGYQFREAQMKDPRFAQIPVVIMTADGHIQSKSTKPNHLNTCKYGHRNQCPS